MEKCVVTKRKFGFKTLIIVCMLLNAVRPQTLDRTLTPCEVEVLLQQLSTKKGEFQMHAAALRNQFRNLLEKYENDLYQQLNTNDINDYIEQNKRDSSSPARNSFYHNEKRYSGALAKSGMSRSQYDDVKRGIATLAKNGQLPSREPDVDDSGVQTWEGKRNLAAMARSGFLNGKRNVATLARDFQLPSSGKRDLPPMLRFIYAPILKKYAGHSTGANLLPLHSEKRNIGAMARDWSLPNLQKLSGIISGEEKRNIGSLKNSREHGKRQKRDVFIDEFDEHSSEKIDPIQSTLDYDELKDVINHIDPFYDGNIHEEKRFLGRILPPTRATSTTHRGRL